MKKKSRALLMRSSSCRVPQFLHSGRNRLLIRLPSGSPARETLARGLVSACVPGLKTITVGGAAAGRSGSSPIAIALPYPWISRDFYAPEAGGLYLDFPVYGFRPRDSRNYCRLLEEKFVELKGIKTLISRNFYARDEFWRIWNKDGYEAVKRQTDPGGRFGDLYEKTHRGV